MEFSKQEMKLFLRLPGLWLKNFFYKMFLIWSNVFKINFQNRKLTYLDLSWPILTHLDLSWPVLNYLDLSWPILTCFDLCWPILTYFHIHWQILTYLNLSRTILTYLDLSWPQRRLHSLWMIMLVRAKYTYIPNCSFIFESKCKYAL